MSIAEDKFERRTDEELMLGLASGESQCIDHLFLRHRQRVYAFFRRRVWDRARAEDLTQETFVAILRAARRYRAVASFRAYLFGIAFGLLRSYRTKAVLRSLSPFSRVKEEGREPAVSEEILWLRQGLARLDETDREILTLREYEQLQYAEIASLLKLPINTVRSRLFRAREALREQLAGQGRAKQMADGTEKSAGET